MLVFIAMKLSELIWGFKISDDTTGGVYVIYAFSTLELLAELVIVTFTFLYYVSKKGAKKHETL
jgi:hypothetical protein